MILVLFFGIALGSFYTNHFGGNRINIIGYGNNKLATLIRVIDDQYVDSIDVDSLVEATIPQVLTALDPHSVYFTAERAMAENDNLRGSFCGVGVEFVIRRDTINVQGVTANGPAARVGLQAGDKIIAIDGETFVGEIVTNDEAMRRLKGERDTKVGVTVLRDNKTYDYVITRGEIPQHTLGANYMINDSTGYIHIRSFGETSYTELLLAMETLTDQNAKHVIIDLRDNGGGYQHAAVMIANEFLKKNALIVYTEGRRSNRHEYRADGPGSYQHIPLTILINEQSASASEVIAGAFQDNDRATIIGRRSFGKGLVQQEIAFNDKSLVRLTVARYYTPSGRCIQRPYTAGDTDNYILDIVGRYANGEFFSEDSIKHSGRAYHTVGGRTVYGGGGITPDRFVAEDTTAITSYYLQVVASGMMQDFAYDYTDSNRKVLSKFDTLHKLMAFLDRQNIVEQFVSYAERNGLKRRNLMIAQSQLLIKRNLYTRIIYIMLSANETTQYINLFDPVVRAAVERDE